MTMKHEILTTADGSNTLKHGLLGELYHSHRGAIGEAQHVYIGAGFDYLVEQGRRKIVVLEAGFGSGLNCWLTMKRAIELGVQVEYHSIEKFPVDVATARILQYDDDKRFIKLHEAPWETMSEFGNDYALTKYLCALEEFQYSRLPTVDLVYWDAFSPDVQQELWRVELFSKVFEMMSIGGVLVTYSAKGFVKQNLRSAGFEVTRLQGALGKRHMVRAVRTR